MLTIWPFGPAPHRSPLRWRPHKELCFDWGLGLSTGVVLSILADVRPPSQWILIKLISAQTGCYSTQWILIKLISAQTGCYSTQWILIKLISAQTGCYSTPAFILIPLILFLRSPSTALFSFFKHVSLLKAKFSLVSRSYAVSLLSHGAPLSSSTLFCIKLFFGPFSLMLYPNGFFEALPISPIWKVSRSGHLRHHRLPLALPYPTSLFRGFSTSPTSHFDSFHSVIL